MAVPEFYYFMKPVFESMANKESWSNAAVVEAVIPKMKLSDTDLEERIY